MPMFRIQVTRIGYATRVIEIEAANQGDAQRIALETAGNHEFTEHDAVYELTHGSCAIRNNHSPTPEEGGVQCPSPI